MGSCGTKKVLVANDNIRVAAQYANNNLANKNYEYEYNIIYRDTHSQIASNTKSSFPSGEFYYRKHQQGGYVLI
jgi:hypothetical protein